MRQVFEEIDARWGTSLVGEFHNYLRATLMNDVWFLIHPANVRNNFVMNISQDVYRHLVSQNEVAHD